MTYPTFDLEDISGVTLMSSSQWEAAVATVPNIPIEQYNDWWLQDGPCFCVSGKSGEVDFRDKDQKQLGIRPYVILNAPNIPAPGEKIFVGNACFTVVAYSSALSDTIINSRGWDIHSKQHSFVKSDMYQYINSDKFKKLFIN